MAICPPDRPAPPASRHQATPPPADRIPEGQALSTCRTELAAARAATESQACPQWLAGGRGPHVNGYAARTGDDDADVILGEAAPEQGGLGRAAGKGRVGRSVTQRVLVRPIEPGQEPEIPLCPA